MKYAGCFFCCYFVTCITHSMKNNFTVTVFESFTIILMDTTQYCSNVSYRLEIRVVRT